MKAREDKIIFPADSIGKLAVHRLRHSARWRVCGVYRCCIYCQDDTGEIICIGTDLVDRGPFAVIGKSFRPLLETAISPGDVLHVEDESIRFSDFRRFIDLSRADIWNVTFMSCPTVGSCLEKDIELLESLACRYAPAESLGVLIPDIFSGSFRDQQRAPSLSRVLHERVAGVMKRICDDLDSDDHKTGEVDPNGRLSALVGIGYGLTPSGDDFCCGLVLGVARMQKGREAERLALRLRRKAERKTTLISLAYFKSLAGTCVSETQALLLSEFGNSHGKDLRKILQKTAGQGSTSGWDMLAGFAFGVELTRKMDEAVQVGHEAGAVC